MNKIQIYQLSPAELAELINEGIKKHLSETLQTLLENQTNGKELMSRHETAEYFAVSLVTLHSWVSKKIIKHYKIGNKTFFKRSELEAVVANSNTAA